MLDLLFVALLQAAAGDPQQESAADRSGGVSTEAPPSLQGAPDPRDTVRCQRVREFGSRTRSQTVCRSVREEEDEREQARRLHDRMTRSAPPAPTPGMGPS